jgi:hypothetical protein
LSKLIMSQMTFSAHGSGRPLFVPPGIPVVRTGPTTRIELLRLLEEEPEKSGIRSRPRAAEQGKRLVEVIAELLRLIPRKRRSPRPPQGK